MKPIQFNKIEKTRISKLKKGAFTSKLVQNEVLGITSFRILKYYKPISRLF